MNPNYHTTVPILINDIFKSMSLTEVYGARGVVNGRQECRLLGNHPIRRVKVVGKVVGSTLISGRHNGEFMFVNLDDCSGKNSIIQVSVSLSMYISGGLTVEEGFGRLVEVAGTLNEFHKKIEINVDSFMCIASTGSLDLELRHWTSCINFKKRTLDEPWVYSAPPSTEKAMLSDPPYKRDSRNDILGSQRSPSSSQSEQYYSAYSQEDSLQSEKPVSSEGARPNSQHISNSSQESRIPSESPLVPVVTETTFLLRFIQHLLLQNCRSTKLVDLYKNNDLGTILNHLTVQRLSFHGQGDDKDFVAKKHEIFHSVRHRLQKEYKLIKTTRNQIVKPTNLKSLVDHIETCLESVRKCQGKKVFDVPNYLRLYKHAFPEKIGHGVNIKIVNCIIAFLVEREGKKWGYSRTRHEWRYLPV